MATLINDTTSSRRSKMSIVINNTNNSDTATVINDTNSSRRSQQELSLFAVTQFMQSGSPDKVLNRI
jgi:hypothetical protein